MGPHVLAITSCDQKERGGLEYNFTTFQVKIQQAIPWDVLGHYYFFNKILLCRFWIDLPHLQT